MAKMMLHCGAKEVDIQDVANVKTPEATHTHFPIPHDALIAETLETLGSYGYDVRNVTHALGGKDNARYFGLIDLVHSAADYGLTVGVRNSHDKAYSAGLVAGTRVFICDNLAMNGEVKLNRKHTRYIMRDLPHLLGRMMGRMGKFLAHQDDQIAAYKGRELSEAKARYLLVEMVKRGAVPVTKLPAVLKEWEQPKHEEFADRNVWSLFNSVTECAKGWGVEQLVRRTQTLHAVCDHFVAA
jgi:hypothetical protein